MPVHTGKSQQLVMAYMSIALTLVLVEDHAPDAELIIRELRRGGYDPQWAVVANEAEFLASLEAAPEVILSDQSLPVFSVTRLLALLQELDLDIPVIVVTGTAGEEKVDECIKLGAADYLLKDNLSRLAEAVAQTISKQRLKREQERAAQAKKPH